MLGIFSPKSQINREVTTEVMKYLEKKKRNINTNGQIFKGYVEIDINLLKPNKG